MEKPKGSSDSSPLKEALKVIAEHIRPVTFWIMDLVGSARMRRRAPLDPTFYHFDLFVAEILNENGARMVEHVEGDRTIAYFDNADAAVAASIALLEKLSEFNQDQDKNFLALPFRVRIGINTGKVLIDPSARLVEQKHPVFDLAGHLVPLKAGRPSPLLIGEETFQNLPEERKLLFGGWRKVDEVPTHYLVEFPGEERAGFFQMLWEKVRYERAWQVAAFLLALFLIGAVPVSYHLLSDRSKAKPEAIEEKKDEGPADSLAKRVKKPPSKKARKKRRPWIFRI
jgi:class 3 adenylate cyclase